MNSAASLLLWAAVWTCPALFQVLVAWERWLKALWPPGRDGFGARAPLVDLVLFCLQFFGTVAGGARALDGPAEDAPSPTPSWGRRPGPGPCDFLPLLASLDTLVATLMAAPRGELCAALRPPPTQGTCALHLLLDR